MAEENQELQRQMEELRNSFQGLDNATKNANVGLNAFGKELKTVPGQLVKGLGGLASSVAKGDTSLKSMNAVVDVAANAISGLAKTVPIFGEALSAAAKGIAEGAKIVVDQLDQTAKTFNAMGATGALVADGMTGLSRQFTTAGLNLQQFQKVVGQNSVALARFRGIAGEGAEDFSKAVGELTQGQDTSLRKLGMGAEDIAATAGAFVTQQTRLGKSQSMSTDQLTAGAKQYAMELDQLSKVTGLSREAIQKQQDAALSEAKFRANYELAMQSGNEEAIKGAKGMMTLQTRMQSFGSELGQGVRDLSAGVANTDAAQKMLNSTGGAALDIINRLKSGQIDQDQAQQELADAYARNKDAQLQIASQVGSTPGVFTELSQTMDFINGAQKGQFEKAKQVQDAQINKTDELTKSTVKAQQNLEAMNVEFSKMAIKLMPAASKAIEAMTDSMKKLVQWANKQFGEGEAGGGAKSSAPAGVGGEFGGDASGAGDAAAAGGVASDAEIAAAKKSVAGSGGGAPPAAAAGGGPPSVNPADFVKFTSGTGDEAHFKQLDPSVQNNFMRMAQDYFNLTGKKLQVNSAFRSPEEQAAVNPGANPKAAPGMSLHNVGRALDIQSDQRSYLEQAGLLSTYGFSPLKGDPPHISAADGAILSGPTSGYKPNLTMHGTEAIVPLNSPTAQSMGISNSENTGLMAAQLEKLEEMVSVMKNQLAVSTKIMQYAS
jgi:uncharacterized protein YcbK (DUF882 family)